MKTVAIIPAFNNDKTVEDVIKKTQKHIGTLIAVNDGSTDDTANILKRLVKRGECTVLTHPKNRGKGAAIRTGIAHLERERKKTDAVIFLDADGEHNPEDIPLFIAALEKADVVLGARTSYRSRARHLLNRWMAFWFKIIDPSISDPSCGFRALRWEVLKRLELRSSDFCIDAEIILEAIKAGGVIRSIAISPITKASSTVKRRDYLRMNNFFDRWVIRNARCLNISAKKRLFVLTSARFGSGLGTLFQRILP